MKPKDYWIAELDELKPRAPKSSKPRNGTEQRKKPASVGINMADVTPKKVRWLWHKRFAIGEITMLDGDPGLGKSTVLTDIIARITTGRPMPCEEGHVPPGEGGGVVIVTTEDSPEHTIQPRLAQAQARLDRVQLVQTVPADEEGEPDKIPLIPHDLDKLRVAIDAVDACLLIIDPLTAHLGDINSHKDQDVRAALAPLSTFATEAGVSVVLVRHLNKAPGGSPLYRGGGSIGIIGAARVGLLMGRHPDDEEGLVLAHVKNNLARPAPSLALHLEDTEAGVARVVWEGECSYTAADLLGSTDKRGRKPTKRNAATEFLEKELAGGPRRSADIWKKVEGECDFSVETAKRAKDELGVESYQPDGPMTPWYMRLPQKAYNTNSDTLGKNAGNGNASAGNPEQQGFEPPEEPPF